MKKFNKEEISFLKENYIKLGRKQCAAILKRSPNSIKDKCRRLGVKNSAKETSLKQSKGSRKQAGEYTVQERFFIQDHSPESAYLLGFLWADGHLHKGVRKSGNTFYQIVLGINTEDGNYISNLLDKSGKWSKCYQMPTRGQPMTYFSCSNTILGNFLENNDYLVKSYSMPTKILRHLPENLKKFFFLGYLDGDGCVYSKGNHHSFIFSSSKNQEWDFLAGLTDKVGCSYSTKAGERANRKSGFSYFSINGLKNCISFGNYLYREASLGLPRKKQKFELMLKRSLELYPISGRQKQPMKIG
jgi:hypothetical protein